MPRAYDGDAGRALLHIDHDEKVSTGGQPIQLNWMSRSSVMRTFTIEDEEVLKAAEARAESEHTSLDEVFLRLVAEYAECQSGDARAGEERAAQYERMMDRIRGAVVFDRMPTREERNARR